MLGKIRYTHSPFQPHKILGSLLQVLTSTTKVPSYSFGGCPCTVKLKLSCMPQHTLLPNLFYSCLLCTISFPSSTLFHNFLHNHSLYCIFFSQVFPFFFVPPYRCLYSINSIADPAKVVSYTDVNITVAALQRYPQAISEHHFQRSYNLDCTHS